MTSSVCPTCGRPRVEHDVHVRLLLPDAVVAVAEEERADRTWGDATSPLLQVQGIGAFVRVLLPIQLADHALLTVATWLAIDPARLAEVWAAWNTPDYGDLALDGYLGNAIAPWGDSVLGAPAAATVRDPTNLPTICSSSHAALADVLAQVWPRDHVLRPYQSVL
jgi:hypothetical protein